MGYWDSKNGIIGDKPADIMGDAIEKIKKHYQKDFKRDPTSAEIRDVFEFVMNPLDDKQQNNMNPCKNCGTTEETPNPHGKYCSYDCWYEAMGAYDGWDQPEEVEEDDL